MSDYRRLTRKRRTLAGSTQLWLGPDHVLMVRSTRFLEEYRRFQFADIQAIVATHAPPRFLLRSSLTVAALLFFTAMVGASTMFGRTTLAVLGAAFLGAAAYDVLRGPRCRCRLLTEVSSENLDPVTRVSDYQRLMRDLAPAIEAVQGRLSEEDHLAIRDLPVAQSSFVQAGDDAIPASRYLQHTLYGILLLNAFTCAAGYLWKVEEALSLAISILMAEVFLAFLMRIANRRFGVQGAMKSFLTVVAVLLALDTISAVVQGGYLIYLVAESGRLKEKMPTFWDISWAMLLGKISITWRVAAGLTGLAALWIRREATSSPEQPAPPPPEAL